MRLGRFGAGVAALAFVAACGSTVPPSETRAATDGTGGLDRGPTSELTVGATSDLTPERSADGEPVASPADGSAAVLAPEDGHAATSPGVSNGGELAASGTGVTDTEIKLGIFHNDVGIANTFYERMGATDALMSDPRQQAQAVVDHINRHGGVAGRSLSPVYFKSGGTSAESTQDQAACTYFSRDQKVFAAIQVNVGNLVFAPCLAKAGTPVVMDAFRTLYNQSDFERMKGLLYQPAGVRADRLAEAWVDTLHAAAYFGKLPKIGLILYDLPSPQHALENTIKPRLEAHGLKLTDVFAMSWIDSQADYSSAHSEISNAVLRFRSQGIDHVMFWATHGGGPSLFSMHAEQQGYRPKYALTSLEQPDLMSKESPPAQLKGAVAVGWMPTLDVSEADDPGSNPSKILCEGVLSEAGVQALNRRDLSQALRICGRLLFLKAALDEADSLDPAGLRAAVDRLGDRYQAPETFGTSFGPNRVAGATSVRPMVFDGQCTCFKYTGSARPIP